MPSAWSIRWWPCRRRWSSSTKSRNSASVVGGATSFNAIPNSVWMEFDMRSDDAKELDRLEKRFLAIANQTVEAENFARLTKERLVSADIKLVGNRPAGPMRSSS